MSAPAYRNADREPSSYYKDSGHQCIGMAHMGRPEKKIETDLPGIPPRKQVDRTRIECSLYHQYVSHIMSAERERIPQEVRLTGGRKECLHSSESPRVGMTVRSLD